VGEWGYNQKVSEQTQEKLHAAKVWLYGSFLGVLALDFIRKQVSNNITWASGVTEIIGLIMLAFLILGLELIPAKKSRSNGLAQEKPSDLQKPAE
jgi:hypothetical protein